MGTRQHVSLDAPAVRATLGEAAELCRRLELPEDAAVFEAYGTRLQTQPVLNERLRDEISGSWDGIRALRIIHKLGGDPSEFARVKNAFSRVLFPEIHEPKKKTSRQQGLAVRDTDVSWQLDGESDLYAAIIPGPPKAGAAAAVRLTLSNPYGPIDDAEFFVRVGNPDNPTDQHDLDSATDWVRTRLVEELVTVGDEQMIRSRAEEPFEEEIPWEGTHEAKLMIPAGRHSIEIKIVSRTELLRSLVLTGWDITVANS